MDPIPSHQPFFVALDNDLKRLHSAGKESMAALTRINKEIFTKYGLDIIGGRSLAGRITVDDSPHAQSHEHLYAIRDVAIKQLGLIKENDSNAYDNLLGRYERDPLHPEDDYMSLIYKMAASPEDRELLNAELLLRFGADLLGGRCLAKDREIRITPMPPDADTETLFRFAEAYLKQIPAKIPGQLLDRLSPSSLTKACRTFLDTLCEIIDRLLKSLGLAPSSFTARSFHEATESFKKAVQILDALSRTIEKETMTEIPSVKEVFEILRHMESLEKAAAAKRLHDDLEPLKEGFQLDLKKGGELITSAIEHLAVALEERLLPREKKQLQKALAKQQALPLLERLTNLVDIIHKFVAKIEEDHLPPRTGGDEVVLEL